jgi:hypothetical protein
VLAAYPDITMLEGEAAFQPDGSVQVGGRSVWAHRYLVATGARPRMVPFPRLDEAEPLYSTTLMNQSKLPGSLVVLGGRAVALELGLVGKPAGAGVSADSSGPPLPLDCDVVLLCDRVREVLERITHVIHSIKPGVLVRYDWTVEALQRTRAQGVTPADVHHVLTMPGLRIIDDVDDSTRCVTGLTPAGVLIQVWLREYGDDEWEVWLAHEAGLVAHTRYRKVREKDWPS